MSLTDRKFGLQTASGASDIMSHLIENYCTAVPDVYMNHEFLLASMKTVLHQAPIAIAEPENCAARSALRATRWAVHSPSPRRMWSISISSLCKI